MRDKAPGGNKPWLSSSPYRCSKRGARPLERARLRRRGSRCAGITLLLGDLELELELIQTQMAQKPMLRAEVGMRVRCANKASAE
jgi:hypothetical protein